MHVSTLTHLFLNIPECGASPHDVRRTMATHGEALLGFSRIDTGTILDHAESVAASTRITSRTAGTGTHDVTGTHYALHDGTHHTWPVMRIWCEALERAIGSETKKLDIKRLQREYGDRSYRIGAPPAPMLVPVGVLDNAERVAIGLKPLRQPNEEEA